MKDSEILHFSFPPEGKVVLGQLLEFQVLEGSLIGAKKKKKIYFDIAFHRGGGMGAIAATNLLHRNLYRSPLQVGSFMSAVDS